MPAHSYTFEALGTGWEISTKDPLDDSVRGRITEHITRFDKTYSRFRKDSLVTKLKNGAGTYVFPKDATRLFAFYRQLYDVSSGKVTPLIGEMLERAGYDANYSLTVSPQKRLSRWDEVMSIKDNLVQTTKPITLDFGAAGKGYAVDLISELLESEGFNDYVVDASGDLRHRGADENRVGLEHPSHPGTIIGVVEVRNRSLCASATNRRVWGNGMHHIFDPDTKSPTAEIIASWVIADTTMLADGLATALFFTEPLELAKAFDFSYVRMHSDGSVDYSRNFKGELF